VGEWLSELVSYLVIYLVFCLYVCVCVYYVCVYACMCVFMYVHFQPENGKTDLHQTRHAYSLRPGGGHRKVKTPGKDRITVPRLKLFVSKRTLQEQRP
jgi:hypothetical protein